MPPARPHSKSPSPTDIRKWLASCSKLRFPPAILETKNLLESAELAIRIVLWRLQPPLPTGDAGGFRTVFCAGFADGFGEVVADGAFGEVELLGHAAGGEAVGG